MELVPKPMAALRIARPVRDRLLGSGSGRMTAALRSLSESLAPAGHPAVVFAALAAELGGRASGRATVDEARLRRALAAAGCRASPHQLSIDLRELGVVDAQG